MDAPAPDAADRLPFSPAVGCFLSVLAGALCATAFFLVLWFGQRGEIAYAPTPLRTARLWLVREERTQGLGLSITRPLPGGTADHTCALTSVRFLVFSGEAAQDTSYCECFAGGPGGWTPSGPCGD